MAAAGGHPECLRQRHSLSTELLTSLDFFFSFMNFDDMLNGQPSQPFHKVTDNMASFVWHDIIDTIESNWNKRMLTNWVTLSDPKDREEFEQFGASRVSVTTVVLVCMLFLLRYVYELSMHLRFISTLFHEIYPLLIVNLCVGIIFIPNCCLLWHAKNHRTDVVKSPFIVRLIKMIPLMESCLAISAITSIGLKTIIRVTNGPCVGDMQRNRWMCNVGQDADMLMDDSSLLLMIMPIIFTLIFKSLRFEVTCLSWAIAIICLAVSIGLSKAMNTLPVFLIYIPFSIIVLCEIQRQDLNLYFLVKQQRMLLAENKQMAEDQQTELRHMIANVAHDLKTPLSALSNGFETITHLAEQSMVASPTASQKQSVEEGVDNGSGMISNSAGVHETVRNLTNVTSFMIMTINRCIDYTKASKGFKLVSKLETINLAEILALPISCMKDLQTRIGIDLLPLPAEICSHIITDKQWLQENLFCLISNAVKYSTGGSITISVSEITDRHPLVTKFITAKRFQSIHNNSAQNVSFSGGSLNNSACYSSKSVLRSSGSQSPNRNRLGSDYSYLDQMVLPRTSTRSTTLNRASTDSKIVFKPAAVDAAMAPTVAATATVTVTAKPKNRSLPRSGTDGMLQFFNGLGLSKSWKQQSTKVHVCPSEESAKSAPAVQGGSSSPNSEKRPLLLIEVEDTGIGLSDEVMAGLFAPFKQAQRRAGGTGLGLYSLAKRLEALGGYYGVQRRKDGKEGSLFWFAIPYTPDESVLEPADGGDGGGSVAEPPQSTSGGFAVNPPCRHPSEQTGEESVTVDVSPAVSNRATSSSPLQVPPPPAGLHILLVDDSVPILKMTTMLLKRQKHTVTQAENGAEALKAIAERKAVMDAAGNPMPPFDVVLMDLNMPVMDGLEATSRIRAQEAATSTQGSTRLLVLGLSANSDHQTMMEAYESGVDDFMCKPFSLQTFHECYQKHISR